MTLDWLVFALLVIAIPYAYLMAHVVSKAVFREKRNHLSRMFKSMRKGKLDGQSVDR